MHTAEPTKSKISIDLVPREVSQKNFKHIQSKFEVYTLVLKDVEVKVNTSLTCEYFVNSC